MQPITRGILLLLGAAAAGVSGTLLADRHLAQRAAAIESSLRADHATRAVLVANQDLPAGARIDGNRVALRNVPITYLHADAITERGWTEYAGARLKTAVGAGEPILPVQLRRDETTRLAELVRAGDRALTLPVSGVSAMAGLLNPADRVDLLLTYRAEGAQRTIPLLADIPIIATGGRFAARRQGDAGGPERTYRDITLAVSPVEAARITQARAMGDIRLVLRGDDDDAALPDFLVDADAITGRERETAVDAVELIIGGRL